ncbi:MAG: flippase-like domain-containing protein, partial [Bacteroidales bacterium]|nr:flippase-like domain-containing protein [Bacteroidales bacterium]
MTEQRTKISKTLNYLIRALIIIVTYGFIYRQVFIEHKLQEIPGLLSGILEQRQTTWQIAFILFLMLVNWSIESVKWKILISRIEKISFFRSFQAVMTGVSVSLFTPNRTGDYLGRVFILEKANHVEGIFITIIGSLSQLVVTLSAGLFCFLSFADQYLRVPYQFGEYMLTGLVFIVPTLVFLILVFYFNIGMLSALVGRIVPGKLQVISKWVSVFEKYSSQELLQVLLLSLFRYVVFSTQFYLLIRPFIWLGRAHADKYPLQEQYDIFFFFPFYHTGGAEKVHAQLAQVFREQKCLVLFTRKSHDNGFRAAFEQAGHRVLDISAYTDDKRRYWKNLIWRGVVTAHINRQGQRPLVINGQCNFAYKCAPWLHKAIPQLELIHSFNSFSWIRIPFLPFIRQTVMISRKAIADHTRQY